MAVCSLGNKWLVKSLLIVLMVMVTHVVEPMAENLNHSGQRKQEIELRLKQLNKQALKSIESSSGEIIDCIYITKQPAFDHPMLKNHTIQMKPSSYPHDVFTEDDDASTPNNHEEQPEDIAQPWHLSGDCPEKTIPIKRITKEDLLRVDYIQTYGKKDCCSNISQRHRLYDHPTAIKDDNVHEYAITYVNNDAFRGAKAQINVWKPYIESVGEVSISQIWVLGGKFGPGLNTLEVGSHVYPVLYGDANPRIFIYWTNDGYQEKGCYNLLCSGFVQINKRISLGALVKPISTYNGPQYILTVQIWKDPKTGNWWLQLNEKDLIGYWPNELFPMLEDSANLIEWGGEVVNKKENEQHTATQMGSGHFPSEGFGKAGHFKTVKIIDMFNGIRDPVKVQTIVSRPTCYNLKTGYSKSWGVFFYYGGPGRNSACP
ncbi:PREDICTED: uncharacterized protein LOC104731544 [Camelina sativa]|uniref:Uncharacterized protein LOC104731544 n=1 Tax=Camelina sativa TaxID=90675 RepID=A0ABM0V153_CAMSA|nr:PREDICTED: uncharacterized protein LOC104731544 [Camelina sativa]